MRILRHRFVSDSLVFFLLSCSVNVLNYLFIVVAARFLTVKDFGGLSAIIAAITISLVLGNGLQAQVTKFVGESELTTSREYILKTARRVLLWCIVVIAISLFARTQLAEVFHIAPHNIALTLFAIAGAMFFCLANGATAGIKALKAQASINCIATIIKVGLLVALLSLGIQLAGAIVAYMAAFWGVALMTYWYLKRYTSLFEKKESSQAKDRSSSIPLSGFLIQVFISIPFMLDQLVVQTLHPEISGEYGALATLGKLVFFASGALISVLFPYLVAEHQDARKQLKYFFVGGGLTLAVAASVASIFFIAPVLFVETLFPEKYLAVAPYLASYSLSLCFYVLSYLIAMYAIAKSDALVLLPAVFAVFLQAFLFWSYNGSLGEMTNNQLFTYGFLGISTTLCLSLMLLRDPATLLELVNRSRSAQGAEIS